LQRDEDSIRSARTHDAAAAINELAAAHAGGRQLFGSTDISWLPRSQAKVVLPFVVNIP